MRLEKINKLINDGTDIELVKQSLALYFQEKEKNLYFENLFKEYENLFREDIKIVSTDEDGNQAIIYKKAYKEDVISFEQYKSETRVLIEAVAQEVDENGLVVVEAVQEVIKLMRPFIAKENYNEEIDTYLLSNEKYKAIESKKKQEALENLIITTSSGKRFYVNEASSLDLIKAERLAIKNNLPDEYETLWKTPGGVMNVTVKDITEAIDKSLEEKARIIGVTNV